MTFLLNRQSISEYISLSFSRTISALGLIFDGRDFCLGYSIMPSLFDIVVSCVFRVCVRVCLQVVLLTWETKSRQNLNIVWDQCVLILTRRFQIYNTPTHMRKNRILLIPKKGVKSLPTKYRLYLDFLC